MRRFVWYYDYIIEVEVVLLRGAQVGTIIVWGNYVMFKFAL